MANPVVHWEISTPNAEKVSQFYTNLFGWSIKHEPSMNYHMAEAGGEGGIGGGIMQCTDAPQYVTFYVMVDDLAAYGAKAESLGGRVIVPPMPIPGVGAFSMIQDPDGNTVGLYKSDQG